MDGRVSITESEILQALREAMQGVPEGAADAFTTTELVEATGRGRGFVQSKLRALINAGVVECVQKPSIDMTGRPHTVPAFRVKAA